MLKDLIKIAIDLDLRGLTKEADILDKIAADIINFEERARSLRPGWKKEVHTESPEEAHAEGSVEPGEIVDIEDKRDERRSLLIEAFVKKNLSPDTKLYDEGGQSELSDYAYNGSEMLKEYMIEVLPDLITDLYEEVGESDYAEEGSHGAQQLVRDILYAAESLAEHGFGDDPSFSEDMQYLAKAMDHYLIKQEYDFGI